MMVKTNVERPHSITRYESQFDYDGPQFILLPFYLGVKHECILPFLTGLLFVLNITLVCVCGNWPIFVFCSYLVVSPRVLLQGKIKRKRIAEVTTLKSCLLAERMLLQSLYSFREI